MKKILCLCALALLIGCGTKPPPAWLNAGYKQLETFKTDFLAGQASYAQRDFSRAVDELKKSNDLDLLGKAWLTRMACQIAVLEEPEAGDFPAIDAAQSVPANRNFFRFLTGDPASVDEGLLPRQYRPFLVALRAGETAAAERAIAAMQDDPLSRLVAAAIAVRHGLENEALLGSAVETASQNGWKRAVLAWLARLESFLEGAGRKAEAEAVRRRIDLLRS